MIPMLNQHQVLRLVVLVIAIKMVNVKPLFNLSNQPPLPTIGMSGKPRFMMWLHG